MAIALTIAGSDSGGGAGIQADLKTFSALGVYGASAITAITAQNTRAVTAVAPVDPAMVRAQIAAVFDDLAVGAVKIGMLATPAIIEAVAGALAGRAVPVVLDPVMVAKSGDALLEPEAEAALIRHLLPLATVLTPNLPEAARLLGGNEIGKGQFPSPAPEGFHPPPAFAAENRPLDGFPGAAHPVGYLHQGKDGAAGQAGESGNRIRPPVADPGAIRAQGLALLALGPDWVLMKGGHAGGAVCEDLLIGPAPQAFRAPRIATRNTHGTGCTLSSAIAAGLAQGMAVPEAVARAHGWLHRAIAAADRLSVGSGHGPVHHFHALWGAA